MSQSEVDLSQVFQQISQAVDQLSQAWATAARSIADSMPEPVKAEQPDRFEHIDFSDDRIVVRPHDQTSGLMVLSTLDDPEVHLDQGAVNRLAQYLDRYRTDQQDSPDIIGAPEPRECWCGRTSDHLGHEYVCEEGTRSVRCLGVSNGVYGS